VLPDARANAGKHLVMLNTATAPFDDVNARLALAYATDQRAFIRDAGVGEVEPADSPISAASKWHTTSGYPQFDPVKARALVTQVKQEHKGQFSFTIRGWPDAAARKQLQVLQRQWEAVGMDVSIQIGDNDKMMVWAVTGSYQATMWRQFDAPDPMVDTMWFNPALSKDPPGWSLNHARVTDPQIDDGISDLMAATDDGTKQDAWARIQARLGADCPYIWLYQAKGGVVARTHVVNLTRWTLPDGAPGLDLGSGVHPLYQVWLRAPR
jgi:peptide/nickel transport system substrate-binding protein